LKPWRRLMSQVLDPTVLPGALDAVTAVDVRHGPHGLPQALFAVGWLASCLSWQSVQQTMQPGVQVSWEFRTSRGPLRVSIVRADEGEPDVQRLRLTWQEGSTRQATFERTGPSRLVATLDDRDEAFAVLSAPRQPRAVLVAKQLPARHGDRLFDQSLRITTTIAQALV
jgi:glucose-6-phosphate dehydrogenase assembly protein OpcA